MTWKKAVGISLIVVAAGLLAFTILSVGANMDWTGPMAGKINTYKPPYQNHGLIMAITGISSAVVFLAGIVMVVVGRKR